MKYLIQLLHNEKYDFKIYDNGAYIFGKNWKCWFDILRKTDVKTIRKRRTFVSDVIWKLSYLSRNENRKDESEEAKDCTVFRKKVLLSSP